MSTTKKADLKGTMPCPSKYRDLSYLLDCYFYKGIDREYDNIEQAIKRYVSETPRESIKSTLTNITNLQLEDLDSKQLWRTIEFLGCEHRYDTHLEPHEWLDRVSNIIKKYLAEKPEDERPGRIPRSNRLG